MSLCDPIRRPDRPVGAGRPGRHRLQVHGRPDLAPERSLSAVLRHARRRAPALGRRARRREVMRPSNKCNGMTYDAELNLIVCEHATSSLDPRTARRAARGARLAFREAGAEQPERRLRPFRRRDLFQRSLVRAHARLWRRAAAAARFPGRLSRPARRWPAELLVDRHLFDQPNGLCFSPDERVLYVNDTVRR